MVSVSLRQKPTPATEQNASVSASTAAFDTDSVTAAAAESVSVRPVSGTPAWARNDHAPGTPRPASPWDEWFIPPKPAALADACENTITEAALSAPAAPAAVTARGVAAVRRPGPHPIERPRPPATSASAEAHAHFDEPVPFRPWRIDFARPDVVEYPVRSAVEPPPSGTVTERLLMLLSLAYLLLASLTSGLAYTGYFTTASENTGDDPDGHGDEPAEDALPPRPPAPRPLERHPNAPGLHTRPDGTRYLVMPLPADIADRFRGRADVTHAAHTAHAAPAIGGGAL